jgi:hypothetical protein
MTTFNKHCHTELVEVLTKNKKHEKYIKSIISE